MSRRDRLAVWALVGEQRQAFNRGVGLCLAAVEDGRSLPSRFDLQKQLTADRASGRMPVEVPLRVQRAGLLAGRDAVSKWVRACWHDDRQVVYWAVRLAAAELIAEGRHEWAEALLAAICCRASLKTDTVAEIRHCSGRLDKASQRRQRHEQNGTRRLFRSRKDLQRGLGSAPALVLNEDALLRPDGTVRLPGGLLLRLADPSWRVPDNHEWIGAVQLVDTTRKITARTRPEHRRWVLHVILRRTDPAPVDVPESADEVLGIDAGVVNHVTVSDGRMLNMRDESAAAQAIREAQQRLMRCTRGSRRWRKLTRELRHLHRQRTNRRDNDSRQIAAGIAKTGGVSCVGAENTNTRGMMRSAAGTKNYPGRGVAAKRGLNRSLSDARFGSIRRDIERACIKRGVRYLGVPAAGTSQICHRCGARVARESQSSYWCAACGIVGHADINAARNVKQRAWRTLTGEPRQPALSGPASQEGRAGGKPAQLQKRLPSSSQTSRGQRPTLTTLILRSGTHPSVDRVASG